MIVLISEVKILVLFKNRGLLCDNQFIFFNEKPFIIYFWFFSNFGFLFL